MTTRKSAGKEPLGPSPPEGGQADAPRTVPLLEQERRDEESRQHEEKVNPEVAARGPAELEVVGHDADHRHARAAR